MNLLDIGCLFDWISPLVQGAGQAAGMHAINVNGGPGVRGSDIKRLLEQGGVRVGGTPMWVNGELCITVDNERRAHEILSRRGISSY